MKYKNKSIIAGVNVFALLMTIVSPFSFVNIAKAAADSTLYFDPATYSTTVGTSFTMTARINPGTNQANSVRMNVTYDQTKVSLSDATCGEAFSWESTAFSMPSPQNGTASITCTLATVETPPVTTDSAVATFSFSALTSNATNSVITFADTSHVWADDSINPDDDAIAHITPAAVTITGEVVVVAPVAETHRGSKKKKKSTPKYYVSQSKSSIKRGMVLTQRGKKFSKKSPVLLYFSKPGGGYYAPSKIVTNASGAFTLQYRVNKPAGKYSWYALDVKTGKKSKVKTYKVK